MRAKRRWRTGVLAAFLVATTVWTAPVEAQIPPAVRFVIAGLSTQLPRKLGKSTVLTRLAVAGDKIDVRLEVGPGSPLAAGVDAQSEAARLCRIDLFRKLTNLMPAQLAVSYVKPDQTPIGSVMIDRTTCRR